MKQAISDCLYYKFCVVDHAREPRKVTVKDNTQVNILHLIT